jgi:hypothetical protein
MTLSGVEHTPNSTGKHALRDQSGAKSGAPIAETQPIDPDLTALVAAWPKLPDHIRAAIRALVGTTVR